MENLSIINKNTFILIIILLSIVLSLSCNQFSSKRANNSLNEFRESLLRLRAAFYTYCTAKIPNNPNYAIKLAYTYDKMNRPDLVEKTLSVALRLSKSKYRLAIMLGKTQYDLQKYSESLESFSLALSNVSKNPASLSSVYRYIARSYRALGNYTLAVQYISLSLEQKLDFWTFYEYANLMRDLGLNPYSAYENALSLAVGQKPEYQQLIYRKLAQAYYEYAQQMKDYQQTELAKHYLRKILNDTRLKSTDYGNIAIFWLDQW